MIRLTGGLRTKAPCNPDAADAGISRRLDICSGVTYHHTVLLAHTSEFKQIAYNLGDGLRGLESVPPTTPMNGISGKK